MRLININTLELEEFFGDRIPKYIILSHTWEDQEISFQDYNWILNYEQELRDGIIDEFPPKQQLRVREKYTALKTRSGYSKILNFVMLVQEYVQDPEKFQYLPVSSLSEEDGSREGVDENDDVVPSFNHVWIDTCCINKESSAELSEAINSMYKWYEQAMFCTAYLSDVSAIFFADRLARKIPTRESTESESDFPRSKWFTRGWTLQELLVPSHVFFFNKDWKYIASRQEIAGRLEEITGIDKDILNPRPKGPSLSAFSVAKRMSWAARRTTTRVEDEAYCLLGLFGVNMPLLYGEGERAFQRLQHEILRTSDDQSLFVWGYRQPLGLTKVGQIFASSPRDFKGCTRIQSARPAFPAEVVNKPFFLTNVGLHISLSLLRYPGGTYAVLPVMEFDGWLIGFPVERLGHIAQLQDIEDGTAVAKDYYRHPMPLIHLAGYEMKDVLKTLTILPYGPRNETSWSIIAPDYKQPAARDEGLRHLCPSRESWELRVDLYSVPFELIPGQGLTCTFE
ncbi:hypothetical protein QBC39DRAFT_358387 [Podospora conica]|nr:hypothetical protein QBC39DRAFT_358387 [Schizothecium conicum]